MYFHYQLYGNFVQLDGHLSYRATFFKALQFETLCPILSESSLYFSFFIKREGQIAPPLGAILNALIELAIH